MTSIYYTIGPASNKLTKEMFLAGARGVRQTFSYGTPEIQLELAQSIHVSAQSVEVTPVIIADLEGGGFRLGNFIAENETKRSITVAKDEIFSCVCAKEHNVKEGNVLPIPDKDFYTQLQVGDVLIVGDGSAELVVVETTPIVKLRSIFEAVIENRRGLWRQSKQHVAEPKCLTQKDILDLQHIAQHEEYNAVGLSFVSDTNDIKQARKIMEEFGVCKKIIAKIETKTALENIVEICNEADEVMVARGDLELAVSWRHLPSAVDLIVSTAMKTGTPFIMATQVAEGMMHGNYLTRAESCDLWHWKQRGMSGVLLSRETCWGERPVLTVERVRGVLDSQ